MKPKIIVGEKKEVLQAETSWDNLSQEGFITLDLNEWLIDTRVSKVFFSSKSISDINNWVNQSIKVENTVEVGGLLIGKQRIDPSNPTQYELKIEAFFPFKEVLAQSFVVLSVGRGMAYAYNDAMEEHPDALVLGWFHTHPGHSPFLSDTDLNQTHNLFNQPYQLAIVLDCLTPDFDTGVFSQKQDGSTNNAIDFNRWLAWKKLLK